MCYIPKLCCIVYVWNKMYTIMYSVCTWNLQAQKKIMIVMASHHLMGEREWFSNIKTISYKCIFVKGRLCFVRLGVSMVTLLITLGTGEILTNISCDWKNMVNRRNLSLILSSTLLFYCHLNSFLFIKSTCCFN